MIPTELVGTAEVPGNLDKLRFYRHDRDFTFRVNGTELMSSRVHGSEEVLAELALRRLGARKAVHVLVGGLGMGFTLARALQLVDAESQVTVTELVPEVVTWNQTLLGELTGYPLKDPRTKVILGDLWEEIAGARSRYDVMLLDVDNGPEGLSRPDNDRLYDDDGLEKARLALRPGGVLAIWSAREDPPFTARLRRLGFQVEEHQVRARRTRGPRRTIWVAT